MVLNYFNFLRWQYNADANTQELPQAYILERCLPEHMPIIVPGENLAFYINTQYGVNWTTSLRLQFVKNGVVVQDISPLQFDIISGVNFNIYADFAIPTLGNGVYTMQIVDNLNAVKATSNKLLCLNSDYSNVSSYLEFTNNQNLYNVRYGNLSNFYQRIRLRITDITGGDYEFNQEKYQSVTSGRFRDLLAINNAYYTFEAYFFDRYAFQALACFLGHDTRYINGKIYSFKEGLSHTPIVNSSKTKGTFQMYDQSFVTVNKCSGSVASS